MTLAARDFRGWTVIGANLIVLPTGK